MSQLKFKICAVVCSLIIFPRAIATTGDCLKYKKLDIGLVKTEQEARYGSACG